MKMFSNRNPAFLASTRSSEPLLLAPASSMLLTPQMALSREFSTPAMDSQMLVSLQTILNRDAVMAGAAPMNVSASMLLGRDFDLPSPSTPISLSAVLGLNNVRQDKLILINLGRNKNQDPTGGRPPIQHNGTDGWNHVGGGLNDSPLVYADGTVVNSSPNTRAFLWLNSPFDIWHDSTLPDASRHDDQLMRTYWYGKWVSGATGGEMHFECHDIPQGTYDVVMYTTYDQAVGNSARLKKADETAALPGGNDFHDPANYTTISAIGIPGEKFPAGSAGTQMPTSGFVEGSHYIRWDDVIIAGPNRGSLLWELTTFRTERLWSISAVILYRKSEATS